MQCLCPDQVACSYISFLPLKPYCQEHARGSEIANAPLVCLFSAALAAVSSPGGHLICVNDVYFSGPSASAPNPFCCLSVPGSSMIQHRGSSWLCLWQTAAYRTDGGDHPGGMTLGLWERSWVSTVWLAQQRCCRLAAEREVTGMRWGYTSKAQGLPFSRYMC